MRVVTVGGLASTSIAAACGLGVVDLPPPPSPAELSIVSEFGAHPSDPSRVEVVVRATLDPGIGLDGAPRRLTRDILKVDDTDHAPSPSADPSRPTWVATTSYPAPGPEGVRLLLPRLEGLGLAEGITMRVRVDATPGSTIALGDGEDLVLTAEPPSNPARALEWSLELTSSSMPAYRLQMTGRDSWPTELRVAREDIPADALPLKAALRIRWDRSVNVFELTPDERYDVELRSIMAVAWTVEAAAPE